MSLARSLRRLPLVELLPWALLTGIVAPGLISYATAPLYVWGDHAGQFMRLWYPLAVSLPQSGRFLDWNPTWYAGYPELQFYPPGAVLVGLALHLIALGQLSPERVYNLVAGVALALPALASYAFLRHALAPLGRLAAIGGALAAAFVTMGFRVMWGGTNAVGIGMVGERLAFGLVPLVLLASWRLVEGPSVRRAAVLGLLAAFLVLLHPFHAPAVGIAAGAYAVARRLLQRADPGARRWPLLVLAAALAAGLTAWWLLPLAVRQTPYAASLVRAGWGQTQAWLVHLPIPNFWVSGVAALLLLATPGWRVRATALAVALTIPAIALLIIFDYQVLLPAGITLLDPIRFIAEFYLASLLLFGLAVAALLWRVPWQRVPWLSAALTVLLMANLLPWLPEAAQAYRDSHWLAREATIAGMSEHPALKGLWQALREDPQPDGRILYTSYYMTLSYPSGMVTPTSLKAMTPYFTGREIVGGTFSHWSPVARLLWVGDARAQLLPERVEVEDNHRLFGIPWATLNPQVLHDMARALSVTTIVADADDLGALAVLDQSPLFARFWSNGFFHLYSVAGGNAEWVRGFGAGVELLERSTHRWRVRVDNVAAGGHMVANLTYYPLWSADADGQALPVRADLLGLQLIDLPPGGPYTVTLSYRYGRPELAGLAASAGASALALWLVAGLPAWRSRARRNRNAAHEI